MKTYIPQIKERDHEVKFTREQLVNLLERLDDSGADIIGVDIREE